MHSSSNLLNHDVDLILDNTNLRKLVYDRIAQNKAVAILDDLLPRLVDRNHWLFAAQLQFTVIAPELNPVADPGQLFLRSSSVDPEVPEPGRVGNL